jgi:hypothetical protein
MLMQNKMNLKVVCPMKSLPFQIFPTEKLIKIAQFFVFFQKKMNPTKKSNVRKTNSIEKYKFQKLVPDVGVEPTTPGLEVRCSGQLS